VQQALQGTRRRHLMYDNFAACWWWSRWRHSAELSSRGLSLRV